MLDFNKFFAAVWALALIAFLFTRTPPSSPSPQLASTQLEFPFMAVSGVTAGGAR